MTTSNQTTFNMTSDQLVTAAMRKLAVLGDGQSPSATQLTNGTQSLNVMLKTLAAKGMPLWAIAEYNLTLTATKLYTFNATTNIPAPLKVIQALQVDTPSGVAVPLEIKTHYDYNLLSARNATGTPTCYWYEPLNQSGILHLWPTPDTYSVANRTVKLVYQKPFQDMVSGVDTLDFPQHWIEAVIYGLAYRLSPEFGTPIQDRQMLAKEADYFLQEALSFGTEEGSMFFSPERNH